MLLFANSKRIKDKLSIAKIKHTCLKMQKAKLFIWLFDPQLHILFFIQVCYFLKRVSIDSWITKQKIFKYVLSILIQKLQSLKAILSRFRSPKRKNRMSKSLLKYWDKSLKVKSKRKMNDLYDAINYEF